MGCLIDVFQVLEAEYNISCLPHYTCCRDCGARCAERLAYEESKSGFVFFTQSDTHDAIESGSLQLSFGGISVDGCWTGRKLQRQLQDSGVMTSWDGMRTTCLAMDTSSRDMQYLQDFVDADLEKYHADATHHFRLGKAWKALRRALQQQRVERGILADSFQAWWYLPDGPGFRRAMCSFYRGNSSACNLAPLY